MNVKRMRRRFALVATAGVVAALGVAAHSASATVIETGKLELHGPGAVFAGSGSFASASVAPGAAATFTVLIANTGNVAGQFNLKVNPTSQTQIAGLVVTAGSTKISDSVTGPDGYFTAAIAAHKTATFTIKVTPPKTATKFDEYFTGVTLSDVHEQALDRVLTETIIKSTTNNSTDLLVTGAGQQSVAGISDYVDVTNPSVKVGASSVYTIKLQNNQVTPTPMFFSLTDGSNCASYFQPSAKVGSTNITTAALAGTYVTPSLAKGKFVTVTVTIKFVGTPPANSCYFPYSVYRVSSIGEFAGGSESANLVTNPAFGLAQVGFPTPGPDAINISPVATPEAPYTQSCPQTFECFTPVLSANDGSANLQITGNDPDSPFTVTAYLGGPANPCTISTASPANFTVDSPTAEKTVTYSIFGDTVDSVVDDYGFQDHVCYESPNDFVGFYANSGVWDHGNDCSCGDYANYGLVPIDPTTGDYLGILDTCLNTSGVPPCMEGSGGSYDTSSPVHSYTVTIDVPAGDPKTSN